MKLHGYVVRNQNNMDQKYLQIVEEIKKEFRLLNLNTFQINNLESSDREDLFLELQETIANKISTQKSL